MIIEIRGVQFENKGAQLMLHAVLQQVEKRLPSAKVALRLNAGTRRRDLVSINALIKLPLRKRQLDLNSLSYQLPDCANGLMQRGGFVTEGAVDAVLDASGFAYGDRWGAGALRASADELLRFRRHGKPYIFLPQAFGPFRATLSAANVWAVALESASLIAVRDGESERALRTLLPHTDKIHRYPDITIGLDVPPLSRPKKDKRPLALIVPNVRVLEKVSRTTYLRLLHDAATQLQAMHYHVDILNHGGQEDALLCHDLLEIFDKTGSTIIAHPDPRILKAIIGSASFVLSSRFHACVAALSQGVPCQALAWTHKYRELFDSFGCPENVTEVNGSSPIEIRSSTSNSTLLSATARQRGELKTLWDHVFRLLQS